MPESAYGPTNNCIGIGNILLEKGHRVIFAAEASWVGRLSDLGFVEDLVSLAPPPPSDSTQDAGQFWTDFIRDTSPEFRKPTIEQLTTFIRPTWQALIDGAKYCQPQLDEIIKRQKPDVIIEDNVNCFPALLTAGVPFVRSMSCNPLEMRGENIPPTFSGYPANDKTGWEDFRKEYDRTHREIWSDYNEWVQSCGAPGLRDLDFIHDCAEVFMESCVQDFAKRFKTKAFVCRGIRDADPRDITLTDMLDSTCAVHEIMDLSFKHRLKVLLHLPSRNFDNDAHIHRTLRRDL